MKTANDYKYIIKINRVSGQEYVGDIRGLKYPKMVSTADDFSARKFNSLKEAKKVIEKYKFTGWLEKAEVVGVPYSQAKK